MKNFKFLIVLLISIICIVSLTACDEDKEILVTDISVDRNAVSSKIFVGDTVDFTKIIVTALMNDGTKKILNADEYVLDAKNFDNNKAGTYTITVTYKDYKKSFNILVRERSAEKGNSFTDPDNENIIVIFAGFSYTFGTATDLIVINDGIEMPVENDELVIAEAGDYTLRYKNSEGETKEKQLRVIDRLIIFEAGKDKVAYDSTVNDMRNGKSDFINKEVLPYYVGTSNEFYFDINLKSTQNEKQIYPTTENLEYSFEVKNDGTYEAIDTTELAEVIDGYKFKFKKEFEGKDIKVTISPRYKAQIEDYADFNAIVMEFTLNMGYNVFSHADLQKYYGALYCEMVNIHREITPVLNDSQKNPDGTPINRGPYQNIAKYVQYDENGDIIKNETANSYIRYNPFAKNDKIVVNGNYFTINAQKLPLLTTNKNNYPDQPGAISVAGYQTEIVNSQTSLFVSYCYNDEYNEYRWNGNSKTTNAELNAINNNNTSFNNLRIIGNTETPRGDMSDEEVQKIVNGNSGSYAGIRIDNGDLYINNCVIRFTCIGVFTVGSGTESFIDSTLIEESWANNIYAYGCSDLHLTKCEMYFAGGSGVWMEDTDYYTGEVYDSNFYMDDKTIIENFVSGSEAWFGANNMGPVASKAKTMIDSIVGTYSQGKRTIIRTEKDSSGKEFEGFNFAVVILDEYDIPEDKTVDYKQTLKIGSTTIHHAFSDLKIDPRNTADGFIAPVGQYTDTTAFLNTANAIGKQVYEKVMAGDAETTAKLQEFMKANNISDMETGITMFAGFLAMNQSFMDENAKFLEIIYDVPGMGSITLITELFAK